MVVSVGRPNDAVPLNKERAQLLRVVIVEALGPYSRHTPCPLSHMMITQAPKWLTISPLGGGVFLETPFEPGVGR